MKSLRNPTNQETLSRSPKRDGLDRISRPKFSRADPCRCIERLRADADLPRPRAFREDPGAAPLEGLLDSERPDRDSGLWSVRLHRNLALLPGNLRPARRIAGHMRDERGVVCSESGARHRTACTTYAAGAAYTMHTVHVHHHVCHVYVPCTPHPLCITNGTPHMPQITHEPHEPHATHRHTRIYLHLHMCRDTHTQTDGHTHTHTHAHTCSHAHACRRGRARIRPLTPPFEGSLERGQTVEMRGLQAPLFGISAPQRPHATPCGGEVLHSSLCVPLPIGPGVRDTKNNKHCQNISKRSGDCP